ncbi:MAG: transglycosylase SLT domain-containing protein [Flavobacterium sp.]
MSFTKIKIKVPDVNRTYVRGSYNYSKPETIKANTDVMNTIYRTYGGYISKWGDVFDIDDSIITGFIATESGGVNVGKNNYDAVGLMQVTPDAVWEMLSKWDKIAGSPLPKVAKDYFNKTIPLSKTFDANTLPSNAVTSQILVALKTPEFNIAVGTSLIRWLLEAFKDDSGANINKVMVSYNSGYYASKNKVKNSQTTEQMVNNRIFNIESRGYLLKMLGKNGFLDLWFKQ